MRKQQMLLLAGLLLVLWSVLPAPVQATAGRLQEKREMPPEGSGPIIGQLPGSGRALAVQGAYAYVGFGGDFVVIDVSDKSAPQEISRLPLGLILDIALRGNYAYVGTASGLQIIDISQPSNPQWHSNYNTVPVSKVELRNNNAYLLTGDGVSILDMTNAPNLQMVGQFAKEIGTPLDIDIVDNYLFLLIGSPDNLLMVLDITDKTNPIEVFSRTEFSNRIAVTHNRYMEVYNACSQICQTTFFASSWQSSDWEFEGVYISTLYNSSSTRAVMTDGLYGYVGKEVGLYVHDIYNEHIVEGFDVSGSINDIQVAGEYIYAVSADYEDWPNPTQEGGFYILPAPSPAHRIYLPFVPHQ